jgi:hypothetical protein
VRILRLGSSVDIHGETPAELRAAAIAERRLADAAGCAFETVLKIAWPTADLPDVVGRSVSEIQPDIVCFNISSFWCESEVVSLRLGDHLGPVGRLLARWLERATVRYEFMTNPLTRLARRLALATIGGRPPFSPGEAAAAIDATLRRIVRSEGATVVVAGSPYSAAVDGGAGARRRAGERRRELFERLRQTCESLTIPYDLPEYCPDAWARGIRGRDRAHFGDEMHRVCGELQGRLMVDGWSASAGVEVSRPPAAGARRSRG